MTPALIIALAQILMLLLVFWGVPKLRRLTMNGEKKISELSWELAGALRNYVEARKQLAELRRSGHLSAAETDHQLALEQVLAAMNRDHKDARRYFELIVTEQTEGEVR